MRRRARGRQSNSAWVSRGRSLPVLGAERLEAGADGVFAHNLFGVSNRDLARIRELQSAYYRELRAIVASSQPAERVVLANLQLVTLV